MDYKDIGLLYSKKEKYLKELDASSYEFQRLLIETLEWKIPNLALVIPPSFFAQKVAEIGCFNGHLIANIAINGNRNFVRYGYDVNNYAIDCGKKIYNNVSFYCQDIFEAEEHFDLLILSDIIEHIEYDRDFLRNCSSLSKNILINLPLEKCINNMNRSYGYNDPSGHLRSYSLKSALNLINKSGLRVVTQNVSCVFDSYIFKKRLELQLIHYPNLEKSINLKKQQLKLLRMMPWFINIYFGTNLFAFLEKV